MTTESECWKALLNGKTLTIKNTEIKVKLKNGIPKDEIDYTRDFPNPSEWEILEEPLYFYQWERLYDGRIYTSEHISDEEAETYGYADRGYRKIVSSKRTWEEE